MGALLFSIETLLKLTPLWGAVMGIFDYFSIYFPTKIGSTSTIERLVPLVQETDYLHHSTSKAI